MVHAANAGETDLLPATTTSEIDKLRLSEPNKIIGKNPADPTSPAAGVDSDWRQSPWADLASQADQTHSIASRSSVVDTTGSRGNPLVMLPVQAACLAILFFVAWGTQDKITRFPATHRDSAAWFVDSRNSDGLPNGLSEKIDPSSEPLKLDINSATQSELSLLPGVGPKTANVIIARRGGSGFRNWSDVLAVPGIGPSVLEGIRQWCVLTAPESLTMPESPTAPGSLSPWGGGKLSQIIDQTALDPYR